MAAAGANSDQAAPSIYRTWKTASETGGSGAVSPGLPTASQLCGGGAGEFDSWRLIVMGPFCWYTTADLATQWPQTGHHQCQVPQASPTLGALAGRPKVLRALFWQTVITVGKPGTDRSANAHLCCWRAQSAAKSRPGSETRVRLEGRGETLACGPARARGRAGRAAQ